MREENPAVAGMARRRPPDRKLAIVICNWNKKDYVLKCVESVFASDSQDYDLIVVDNASTDGSAEAIAAGFGNSARLIVNSENRGGSGGFNTGIREALKNDYRYIYLLDNDVIIDDAALQKLVLYLDSHPQAAIAGSAIYSMDRPDELQESGAWVDWEGYSIKPRGKGWIAGAAPVGAASANIASNEAVICDYVPACSMLVRAEAVRKVGLMDETNFIYWDDIEWAHRMSRAGYEIAVLPFSKVWHKMGASSSGNTISTYYFWRNRLNFFLSNLPVDELPRFAQKIFAELFQAVYACNFNRKYRSARTILFAARDALANVRGKALDGRIVAADPASCKLENLLIDKKEIFVTDFEDIKTLRGVIDRVVKTPSVNKVAIVANCHDRSLLREQFPGMEIIADAGNCGDDYSLTLRICRHVMELGDDAAPGIYIDGYFNLVASQADLDYVKNFTNAMEASEAMIYPIFLDMVLSFKKPFAKCGK